MERLVHCHGAERAEQIADAAAAAISALGLTRFVQARGLDNNIDNIDVIDYLGRFWLDRLKGDGTQAKDARERPRGA